MDIYSSEKVTATTIRCSSSFSLCLESSIVSLWFVVCAINEKKSMNLIVLRIYPDVQHWNSVLPKLETFWRICILPEILGRWYTRRCTVPPKLPYKDGFFFSGKSDMRRPFNAVTKIARTKGFTLPVFRSPP